MNVLIQSLIPGSYALFVVQLFYTSPVMFALPASQ